MHLPDGFLDARTAALSAGAALAGVSYALRQARQIEPRRVPMLGMAGAFIFAAQMLNFPIAGGTSGHVVGGVLAAVLLGPAAAVIVMTCVLIVQSLMFADGGILSLGANVFNMALVSTCGGYMVFRVVRMLVPAKQGPRGIVFAAAFAGWCGTMLGAISCAGQLAFSNTAPWELVFPAMANIHSLIGLGEGLATGLIVAAVLRVRPELVAGASPTTMNPARGFLPYLAVISLGCAVFLAPFCSVWPDGLEKVARQLGFEHRAADGSFPAAFPDYQVPFIGSPTIATMLAAALGAIAAFVAAWLLARFLVPTLTVRKNAAPGQ